jgi:hypothetical protein
LVVAGKLEMEVRNAQKSNWEEDSNNLTVEAMMLNTCAAISRRSAQREEDDDTAHLTREATRFQRRNGFTRRYLPPIQSPVPWCSWFEI